MEANTYCPWDIEDIRLDRDSNGEAIAHVINCSDTETYISKGMVIGTLCVSRIESQIYAKDPYTLSRRTDDYSNLIYPPESVRHVAVAAKRWVKRPSAVN